jgi:tRNA dimethylallyltransferase
MQVYRGLDIGTAKPPSDLLTAIPHHLLDILHPAEQFDVGQFVARARALIAEISSRGVLPVVAGGTGYYLKHLLFGLPQAPPSQAAVRDRLQRQLESNGLAALRARLRSCDPQTAARTADSDVYRTLRALEVFEQTGQPLSQFALHGGMGEAGALVVELCRSRDELAGRISDRVGRMFSAGLRREAQGLAESGCTSDWPARQAIGYREFFRTDGSLRPPSEDAQIRQEIESATRRYAKRQRTFANQFPQRIRLHAEALSTLEVVAEALLRCLDSA